MYTNFLKFHMHSKVVWLRTTGIKCAIFSNIFPRKLNFLNTKDSTGLTKYKLSKLFFVLSIINNIQTFFNIKYFQNDEVHNLRIHHIKKMSENLSIQKFNRLNFL